MIPRTFENVPTWSVAITGNKMPPRDPNDDDDEDEEEDNDPKALFNALKVFVS
jgi:hypothetical protein